MPPAWALWVGVLPLLRVGVFEGEAGDYAYWSRTYWGGALSLAGGALLYGAARRLARSARPRDGALMAAGLALLANTRPYEGLLAAMPAVVLLAVEYIRKRTMPVSAVLSLVAVLTPTFGFMAYYNYRVTGDPLRLPYWENEAQYEVAPHFITLPLQREPEYRNPQMRQWYAEARVNMYLERRERPWGRVFEIPKLAAFLLGPALALPLLFSLWSSRIERWHGAAAAAVLLVFAGQVITSAPAISPHYLAPAMPLAYLLAVQAVRRSGIRLHRRGLAVGILLTTLATFALSLPANRRLASLAGKRFGQQRWEIEQRLLHTPGRHLILVRYQPGHPAWQEWVYNRAEPDDSRIVWARELESPGNLGLLSYFSDRKYWLLEAGDGSGQLKPYPRPSSLP